MTARIIRLTTAVLSLVVLSLVVLLVHLVILSPSKVLSRISLDTASVEESLLEPRAPTTLTKLSHVTTRYYIYDNINISQSHILKQKRDMGKAALLGDTARIDHIIADANGERCVHEALENHPSRTYDPNEATFFVIPTPISELMAYGCRLDNCTWFHDAFRALGAHPVFRQRKGHDHLLVAQGWLEFNRRFLVPALTPNYELLENVTVAHHYDPFGCKLLAKQTRKRDRNFGTLFRRELPVTNAFSIGLGLNKAFATRFPSLRKFRKSSFFIFYHTRTRVSVNGSQRYRAAPLKVKDALPGSSIGYDIPRNEWIEGIASSQFCLVIRGDTPHSHSLLYAVRAGCIPVVVSDYYEAYAGPFISTLNMRDYCIFIKEQAFLSNTAGELLKLKELSMEYIDAKLLNLSVAQAILLPDHPESLFVPTLLKEATVARGNLLQ